MTARRFLLGAWLSAWCFANLCQSQSTTNATPGPSGARSFPMHGLVLQLAPDARSVVIQHAAVTNYMAAMTMSFHVKSAADLAGLQPGDRVTFRLHVTDTESWIDGLDRVGAGSLPPPSRVAAASPAIAPAIPSARAWLHYPFTNELGQAVTLNDFKGQALALTFFYSRCPLPDYCPRLSKNFEQASHKLAARSGLATNWHFLSISFDPQFDSPAMLKAYALSYHYDPAHWSFLTGPEDKIADLARRAGVDYHPALGTINHNFRTLIVDTAGHLQMVFPIGGDLSDQIVSEMINALSPATSGAPEETTAHPFAAQNH